MMKKVLVLGIKGMAGHIIFSVLPKLGQYEVYGLARNVKATSKIFNIDVSNTDELKKIIDLNFDIVINCIGILNEDAENNPHKAIWFNSYFPHLLEFYTQNTMTKIISISTDCVFSGNKGNYSEIDVKDGEGFYSQSKALGEINNNKDLTIRTSIIGPELNINGIGLFNWFMHQKESIYGYKTAIWSGVTTLELAKSIDFLIHNPITGVIQLTNGIPISKFDLLQLINKIWRQGNIDINEYYKKSVNKSLKKSDILSYVVPSYEEMLMNLYRWMIENSHFYKY
jgi:dTDP-4-dehydrorhamnose reductase